MATKILSAVVLIVAFMVKTSSGQTIPTSVPPAADRLGGVDQRAAAEMSVSPESWRVVRSKLLDVYSSPAVSKTRSRYLDVFHDQMSYADTIPTWEARKAARDAAVAEIRYAGAELELLITPNLSNEARVEFELALAEINLLAMNYAMAAKLSQKLLSEDASPLFKAQAYYISVRASELLNDQPAAASWSARFSKEQPLEAEAFLHPTSSLGRLSVACSYLEFAQSQDDFGLQFPEMSDSAIITRNEAISAAKVLMSLREPRKPGEKGSGVFSGTRPSK